MWMERGQRLQRVTPRLYAAEYWGGLAHSRTVTDRLTQAISKLAHQFPNQASLSAIFLYFRHTEVIPSLCSCSCCPESHSPSLFMTNPLSIFVFQFKRLPLCPVHLSRPMPSPDLSMAFVIFEAWLSSISFCLLDRVTAGLSVPRTQPSISRHLANTW